MTPVQLVWQPQPGVNRLSFGANINFAADNSFSITTRASFQDVSQDAQFVTIDNLANINPVTVQLGVQALTVPPFQRVTVPAVNTANKLVFSQAFGAGIVGVQLFNYNPSIQDSIDFLAILRQVTIAPGSFCDDLTGWPNMTGAISPIPLGVPVDGTIIAIRAKTNQSGLILGTFNLNGTGAFPVRWRGVNPLDQTIKAGQIFLIVKNGGTWQLIEPQYARHLVNKQYSTDAGILNLNPLVFTNATVNPQNYFTSGLGANSQVVVECSFVAFASGSAAGDFISLQLIEEVSGLVSDTYFYGGNIGALGPVSYNDPLFIRWNFPNIITPISQARFRLQTKSSQATAIMSAIHQQWVIGEIPN